MPEITDSDTRYLERAIALAALGGPDVSPNPRVGAVIVKDGEVLGEGYHHRAGGPHAEREAIRDARERHQDISGATIYVSLEPCCHHGRTPPCTDAIIEAGFTRVVVAAEDPAEHASGRGLGILRDEGIEVQTAEGTLAHEARVQNQPFRKHAKTGRPWVLFKSAMSLDGKVATSSGDSKWISGPSSRALVHRWRAEYDAIAVGIGTALADDPALTARTGGSASDQLADKQPNRVVFDSLAQLPTSARLFEDINYAPLTIVVSRAAPRAATDAFRSHGAEVITATGGNEPARVQSALSQLGSRGITSLLLEGGPRLAGAFLDAGEVDEVRLFMAPVILGSKAARGPFESQGAATVAASVHAVTLQQQQIGDDVLVTARIKEW